MKIVIFASIGAHNLWDELILKNEIQLFKQQFWSQAKFRVFTYDIENILFSDSNVEYLEYFPIGIKKPKNLLRNMKNYFHFIQSIKWADKIVFWWGGIFFDNEVWNFSNPLNQWLMRTKIIKFFNKELIIYAVSIDIHQEKNIPKIKKIFSSAKEIWVRDKKSYEFLKNIWIDGSIIKDPVFYDNGGVIHIWAPINKIQAQDFTSSDLAGMNFQGKRVWLALRSGYLLSQELLIPEIVDYIEKKWWQVTFLPHSFHPVDMQANDFVFLQNYLTPKSVITSSLQETYEIYIKKQIDICLSMRLHSMILCQSYEIDFVAISYAKKTDMI